MNFIFQYTYIYTTHTYNYIHIFVSHCIINVIVYGLGGGCSLKTVLPNTPNINVICDLVIEVTYIKLSDVVYMESSVASYPSGVHICNNGIMS